MNRNQQNKVKAKFLLLLATINSPDVISDSEMELTKQLVDTMLKDYTFLSEHKDTYYVETEKGVQGGKYLMAEVHKMWDAIRNKWVNIDARIYNDPTQLFDYILRDNYWSSDDRWVLASSAIDFMLQNRANEIKEDSVAQHNAFVTLQEATDALRSTPGITNVLPKDFFWERINAFLYHVEKNKFYSGKSLVEEDVLVRMANIINAMKDTEAFAKAFNPTPEVTTEEAVEETVVEATVSKEE